MKTPALTGYRLFTFAPEGRAFLNCRMQLPEDFQRAELPAEEIDFAEPKRFLPLGVAVTGYGPLVVSVAARPAYDDGTVMEWLAFLCREEGYAAGAPSLVEVGGLRAVAVEATQAGDGITMHMRLVLLENGGRLFQLSAMAPVALWPAMEENLNRALATFELDEVQAPRAALVPGMAVPVVAAAMEQPTAAEPEPVSAPVANEVPAASAVEASAPAPTAKLTDAEFAELVLADDAASLDPEHRINANLRERGAGFAAKVVALDAARKRATVGASALMAAFPVPFGWHAIDDGRRALVFDAGGRMQISINRRRLTEENLEGYARALIAEHLAQQPDLPVLEQTLDGIAMIAVRGVVIDGETLDQAFLVRPAPEEGLAFVARVTGTGDDMRLAMNLAGEIMVRLQPLAEAVAGAA